jgi:threonylcarbamoyladenosine tRNA methylthiotransferase MtaB
MRVFFDLIGCRVNEAEIETMSAETLALRHEIAPAVEAADWIVINTCTVTREAERDSRQKIRQAHARNGAARIAVTGCWATMEPGQAAALPGVSRVIPNVEKEALIPAILGGEKPSADAPASAPITVHRRTRAHIKVQDGCDNACTYCVTRLARGPLRSRPADAILSDLLAAQRKGAKEAVLAGVHLGAWGRDLGSGLNLENLLEDILARTAIPRLRLSSLEPWDLRPEFFRMWSDKRLCPHLHLPLQSGCESTLRRMNRRTSPEEYADIVAAARSLIPDLAVTTDLMVGFPGEDEPEFRESIGFIERMGFARLHIFRYSPRPGTAAARLPAGATAEEIRHRAMWARHIGARAADTFSRSFLGREMDVLWEADTRGGLRHGLTGNFLRVRVQSEELRPNTITRVRLASVDRDEIIGELKN